MAECMICFEPFESPVVIPCGHVYCEQCLTTHIQAGNDANSSHCPNCRAKFNFALPNLQYIPTKYHPFILPPIRRLYLSNPSPLPNQAQIQTQVISLQAEITSLATSNVHFAQRCALQKSALSTLAEAVRDTKAELETAETEVGKIRADMNKVRADAERTKVEGEEAKKALGDLMVKYLELKECVGIRSMPKSPRRELEPQYRPTLSFNFDSTP